MKLHTSNNNSEEVDIYKGSRFLYVLEATFEYFISLLVSGAYLAKLTSSLGIPDYLTGILSSFVSLGCGFQMLAIFLANKRPVKRWVTVLHSINQLSFALVYLMPIIKLSQTAKTILFIAFLLIGHIINNIVNSPKINWFMSLVDEGKRGSFTAGKEMVSLLSGMAFTFIMGTVVDSFEAKGNFKGSFIVCGITVFTLMILHSVSLIFSKEKPVESKAKTSINQTIASLFKDKNLFKVILISVLWNVAHCTATPFYRSYQIKELGFTMTFVSILSASYSVVRTLFSKPIGNFADKYSFANMLNICFATLFVGFIINSFCTPANGKIIYSIYYMLYAIGMAGINSATINLIYDYVDKDRRVGALALKSTLAGIAGFFTTLATSPLVAYVQNSGNRFLGFNVYAQQVTSAIAAILTLLLIVYLNLVVRKIKRNSTQK